MIKCFHAVGAMAIFISVSGLFVTAAEREEKSIKAEIKIDNFAFTPTELTVKAGTTVEWVNRDDIPHVVVSDDKKTFKSKVAAWQWLLQGHRLKGILLNHLAFAVASAMVILASWWMHFWERRHGEDYPAAATWRIPLELAGVLLLIVTGHLGGFLSGVNGVV